MVRHISSHDARAQFTDLLSAVYDTNEKVIVEEKGKAVAVVISPQEYAALMRAQERAWDTLDALRVDNATQAPEDVLADVTAAVEEARQARHEQ